LVKVVDLNISDVIKPWTCSYARTLRFLILSSLAYFVPLGKFSFRA